jgi:hypothetical protein
MRAMKNKKKSKMVDGHWANAVGQTTLLRIDWKSWKDEMPKSGRDIIVICRYEDGYSPLHAEYWDERLSPGPNGRFQSVKFRDSGMPRIFLNDENWDKMVAWGYLKQVFALTKKCPICKNLQCQC